MQPEQIPGSLFVLIMMVLGLVLGEYPAVFLLGLGCAFGWQTFNPHEQFEAIGRYGALLFWSAGTIILATRIFL